MNLGRFSRTWLVVVVCLTVSLGALWQTRTAEAAGPWRSLNPTLQGENLNQVIYAHGQFVAVGDQQTIMTSPDGVAWTVRRSFTKGDLTHVLYGDGLYMAVGRDGDAGLVLTSVDGFTWSDVGKSFPKIDTLSNGFGQYILTSGNVIFSSTDGSTWQQRTTDIFSGLSALVFGNDRFVGADRAYAYVSAADGKWAKTDLRSVEGLSFQDGRFTAKVDEEMFATSTDGLTWMKGPLPESAFPNIRTAYANGSYFVWKQDSLWRSADAQTWQATNIPYNRRLRVSVNDIAYGSGTYVAVGDRGLVTTSADVINWTERATFDELWALDFAEANGTYVVVGRRSGGVGPTVIAVSVDGAKWVPQPASGGRQANVITSDGSRFVVAGSDGAILSSTDGYTWVDRTTRTDIHWRSAAAGGGTFLLYGASSNYDKTVVALSKNGAEWEFIPVSGWDPTASVQYQGGQFFALGYGDLQRSVDGRTWTTHPVNVQAKVVGIASGGGRFVAVARPHPGCGARCQQQPAVLTSSDGVRWSSAAWPHAGLVGISFANGDFHAVSTSGEAFASKDGVVWRTNGLLSPVTPENPQKIKFAGGKLVVLGYDGSFWLNDGGCAGFTDMNSAVPSCGAVAKLAAKQVLTGLPGGTVNPYGRVTRAEFAKMLTVAMGWSLQPGGEMPFSDVKGHWAHTMGYLQPAFAHQALQGMGDGTFQPDGLLTRSQVIKIVAAAKGLAPSGKAPYSDVPPGHWSGPWIAAASAANLVGAKADSPVFVGDRLNIERPATREEAAMVLANLLHSNQ